VGPVSLPAGRWHYEEEEEQKRVAWVTDDPMRDAGAAWFALSRAHAETGLVPVLLSDEDVQPGQEPYFGFYSPVDVALIDQVTAAGHLAGNWEGEDVADDPYFAARFAPFGPAFPGLAPAEAKPLPADWLRGAVAIELPSAYLGLVAAGRPADVPAVVGWQAYGAPGDEGVEMGTVLRSWEDRFGARLLRIGAGSTLQVLVERPPRSRAHARHVAAEHLLVADECTRRSGYSVAELGDVLIDKPIWTFWWD
jgi:hypothetical protein